MMAVELDARTMDLPAAERRGAARAGLAMSLATFAMAVSSAVQAVLYLSGFGVNGRTDGFFVAFALYTTFGVFSQSLRLTAAPLLVQPGARLTPSELLRALSLVALPVVIATFPLAGPLAGLLAPGLSESDRLVTEHALPILGTAVTLQCLAAGGATILAVRSCFSVVAAAYAGGAGASLIAYGALVSTADELTLGWSMLTMAVVTTSIMAYGVLRSGGLAPRSTRPGIRAAISDAGMLLGQTAIYFAFNILLVVTLAFASSNAGDATVLSYAYLFASYLVAGTATALGMSRIPEMTRQARSEQVAAVRATVPVGFRYAMLLVAPALAGLIAAGASLMGELFPSSLDHHGVDALRTFTLLLVPWTVAALLVNLLLPMMFATGRGRLVNLLSLPLAAVHVAGTALASEAFDIDGAVAAFCLAPALFAILLIVVGAGPWASALACELAGDGARLLAAAGLAFGAGAVLAAALSTGVAEALIAAVAGSVLYAALLPLVAGKQVRVVLRALRPGTA